MESHHQAQQPQPSASGHDNVNADGNAADKAPANGNTKVTSASPPHQSQPQHEPQPQTKPEQETEPQQAQRQTQSQSRQPASTPAPALTAAGQRGGKRGGRARGSSRGGRPSTSSGDHRPHNVNSHSPGSMTNIINFGAGANAADPPISAPASIHARTPASRGRGRNISSHSHSHSHSDSISHSHASSSPASASADLSSSATPNMDFVSRSDRAPKQGLNHSFTFSTPQPNNTRTTGRKRARTLDYPTDGGTPTAGDDAKVKGGHSLRKRARIDYAQMNDDDDHSQHPPTVATADEPHEITVSGARAVRKRKPAAEQGNAEEHQDEQPQPAPAPAAVVPKKRVPRADKQRTASPVPQRRPYTKRKSTAPAAPAPKEDLLPEQQPSDTELKDTIEVGAPMVMQFTSSSSNGHSETASNGSGRSPSHNGNAQQAIISQTEVASPTAMQPETAAASKTKCNKEAGGEKVSSIKKGLASDTRPAQGSKKLSPDRKSSPSLDPDNTVEERETSHSHALAVVDSLDNKVDRTPKKAEDQPSGDDHDNNNTLREQLQAALHNVSAADLGVDTANNSHQDQPLQVNHITLQDLSQLSPTPPQPSSQESNDSDATEIVPIELMKPTSAASTSTISEQPKGGKSNSQVLQTRLAVRKTTQQTTSTSTEPQRQEEMDSVHDLNGPSLRPRRRLNRIPETPAAAVEEALRSPKEKPPSASKKIDGRTKAATRSASLQDITQPTSPETPRKRGPGRPPKIRQSIEQEHPKPKARRASRNVGRIQQPRPIRSQVPRDFSFLTPYQDGKELYPEINQNSGMATPMQTPTLQASEGADEQGEDLNSMAADKDSASQDPQPGLEADLGTNAPPSPTALSDMQTPGPESAAPSRNPSPEPMVESMRKPKPRKQFGFPRIRSPTEFTNILDDHKNMTDEDLYNLLEVATKTLTAWQEEWKEHRLITEDEDNAVRRRAHDAALVAREARDLAKTNGPVTMEKRDFEVKGLRADRPNKNKHLFPGSNPEAYERREDQIAAQALGFEWDPRASMIGRQDPISQREGLQNTRLRNRPKLSQRAAEAAIDEPLAAVPGIVPGKRTRKPRLLSDGQSQEPSRAPTPVESTPVAPPARRRRRKRNAEGILVDSDNEAATTTQPVPQPDPAEPPVKKKRGPKPKAVKEAEARAAAEKEAAERVAQEEAAAVAAQETEAMDADQPMTRKRRRVAAAPSSDAQTYDIPSASIEETHSRMSQEEPTPKRRRGRVPKAQPALYSTASTNDDTITEELVRPSTSSSTSSMRTVGSSYSFRARPRKNYSEMATGAGDPIIKDAHGEPQRPKRGRKPKNAAQQQDQQPVQPTSYPSSMAQYVDGPQYAPAPGPNRSVLAPPNNNPFINMTGGGPTPGPLLAPSLMRSAAPQVTNPFSAPSGSAMVSSNNNNHSHDLPQHDVPSPPRRKGPLRIKVINSKSRNQTATPQPSASEGRGRGVRATSHLQAPSSLSRQATSSSYAPAPASLQPPTNFNSGHEGSGTNNNPFGHPGPQQGPSSQIPGQVMFPVNASPSSSGPPGGMSMPQGMQVPTLQQHHHQQHPHNMGGGGGGSDDNSARATPVPAPSSEGVGDAYADGEELSEKDYASMTKSEKMSASMKARWRNGSMRQAVNKRKETLARKKQKQDDTVTATGVTGTQTEASSIPPEDQRERERTRLPSTPTVLPPSSGAAMGGGAFPDGSNVGGYRNEQQQQGGPGQRDGQDRQGQIQGTHGFGVLHLVGGNEAHPRVATPAGGMAMPLGLTAQAQGQGQFQHRQHQQQHPSQHQHHGRHPPPHQLQHHQQQGMHHNPSAPSMYETEPPYHANPPGPNPPAPPQLPPHASSHHYYRDAALVSVPARGQQRPPTPDRERNNPFLDHGYAADLHHPHVVPRLAAFPSGPQHEAGAGGTGGGFEDRGGGRWASGTGGGGQG